MWIGYMWFVIKYPNYSKGDTIKATFILQLIQLLPFFGSIVAIHNLKNKWIFILTLSLANILFLCKKNMSKRYGGKSFKDSSIKKKAKLSFKEKRKLKKEKQKKAN